MSDRRKKGFYVTGTVRYKAPYDEKFMTAHCINEQDIQSISPIFLPRYKNVQLMQGLTNNKLDFRIQVKGVFGTERN